MSKACSDNKECPTAMNARSFIRWAEGSLKDHTSEMNTQAVNNKIASDVNSFRKTLSNLKL